MKNLNWTQRIKLNTTGVSTIRDIPGVYRLIYLDHRDNNYYVFHIGQSENLKTELAQHLPWRELNPHLAYYLNNFKCFFRAATVEHQVERDMTEVALYRHFLPQCLRLISNIQPMQINFD
jgi:hypothetical protein